MVSTDKFVVAASPFIQNIREGVSLKGRSHEVNDEYNSVDGGAV